MTGRIALVSDTLQVVVLAAGKGTRLKNRRPKVLQRAGGASLVEHVLRAINGLRPFDLVVVVGHQGAEVAAALTAHNPRVVYQEPQLGTGHALLSAVTEQNGRDACAASCPQARRASS